MKTFNLFKLSEKKMKESLRKRQKKKNGEIKRDSEGESEEMGVLFIYNDEANVD